MQPNLHLQSWSFGKCSLFRVFFALFKTYGIPSISKLLVATGKLSASETASKCAADTGVVITEVLQYSTSPIRGGLSAA
jgi:hypothetical protein